MTTLVGQATPRGLVLAVDDAHLLDDASASAVHHLVTRKHAQLVASLRSPEPCPAAIQALWKDDHVVRVDLRWEGGGRRRPACDGRRSGGVGGCCIRLGTRRAGPGARRWSRPVAGLRAVVWSSGGNFDLAADRRVVGFGALLGDSELDQRGLEVVAPAAATGEAGREDHGVIGEHRGGKALLSGDVEEAGVHDVYPKAFLCSTFESGPAGHR